MFDAAVPSTTVDTAVPTKTDRPTDVAATNARTGPRTDRAVRRTPAAPVQVPAPSSAQRPERGPRPSPRVALYSHDAQGLGHTRRNLAIAAALSRLPSRPDIVLITGAPEATNGDRPDRTEVVGLPALAKDADGGYAPRRLSVDLGELISLRTRLCAATVRAFAPDLLIVDKHPRGAFGELEPALTACREAGTWVVLGLRDVLDEPRVAAAQWQKQQDTEALARWYDEVWVYSDPLIADPLPPLSLPTDLHRRATYVGYLAHGRRDGTTKEPPWPQPYVLGMAGGGSDGAALAEAFIATRWPDGLHGVFVTGPQLPAGDRLRLERLARGRCDVRLLDRVDDPGPLLEHARAVVGMGGYNTVCELLAEPLPFLVVPRTSPRREQQLRADKLATAGLLDVLDPTALTPAALRQWAVNALARPVRSRLGVDLDGLRRVAALANERLYADQCAATSHITGADHVAP